MFAQLFDHGDANIVLAQETHLGDGIDILNIENVVAPESVQSPGAEADIAETRE